MGRPVGVTIISILYFLGAVLLVLAGIGMMVGGGFMATLMNQGGQGGAAGAGVLASLGAAVGIVILVFAVIPILVGWGLWGLKEWARIVAIVLSILGILFGLLGLLGIFIHFNVISFAFLVCRLAINAFIIWYLLQPDVKAAFRAQARTATA